MSDHVSRYARMYPGRPDGGSRGGIFQTGSTQRPPVDLDKQLPSEFQVPVQPVLYPLDRPPPPPKRRPLLLQQLQRQFRTMPLMRLPMQLRRLPYYGKRQDGQKSTTHFLEANQLL